MAKWVKPKTPPAGSKAPTRASLSDTGKMTKLAAKQGFKPPSLGEQAVMAFMKPFLSDALAGKPSKGQELGKKPKAAPLKKPVKDVKQLAQASAKDAERAANPKNMPEVSSIPASKFGPGIKNDRPAKGGVVGMDIPGMAAARKGRIDGEQIGPDIDEGLTAEMEGFKPKSKVAGKELGVT